MAELMDFGVPLKGSPFAPGVEVDEAAARRQLREQVARLETELGTLFSSAYPRPGFDWKVGSRGGPRVLSLADLERVRDELVTKLQHNRAILSDRTYTEELHRRQIEEMLLAPHEHKWVRVTNADIGEPGCKSWHVVPRLGMLGILASWWHVKISSGCPLAGGRGPSAAALIQVIDWRCGGFARGPGCNQLPRPERRAGVCSLRSERSIRCERNLPRIPIGSAR